MKGLPFSLEMARAWHEGRKTVHRRLMKQRPFDVQQNGKLDENDRIHVLYPNPWTVAEWKPPYQPGEVVYIQEPWAYAAGGILKLSPLVVYQIDLIPHTIEGFPDPDKETIYDYDAAQFKQWVWRSPVLMPQKFSRSKARITGVRVERVQEITKNEFVAYGLKTLYPGSWERNDYVWVYGLEKL